MTMWKVKKFILDQSGAVTVDWVVLTASIVGLNIVLLIGIIENGASQAGSDINSKLEGLVTGYR